MHLRTFWRQLAWCFVCACVVGTADAQTSDEREWQRYVVMPSEQVMLTVASQPDCPLHIESARLLVRVKDGGWAYSFELWNRGTKPIRGYTIAALSSWWSNKPNLYLLPGQKLVDSEEDKIEIVPLSQDLRDKLRLHGYMKGVEVLMVIRVEFADGTVYDNEPAHKALNDYFDGLEPNAYGKKKLLGEAKRSN